MGTEMKHTPTRLDFITQHINNCHLTFDGQIYPHLDEVRWLAEVAADLIAALERCLDTLIEITNTTDSFCEVCHKHAPKNEKGEVIGPIIHAKPCVIGFANFALSKAKEVTHDAS